MKLLLIRLIDTYRIFLSPFLGKQCRFHPSCSEYAKQAVEKHNLFYALTLTIKRILRCNPWNQGGIDLVP